VIPITGPATSRLFQMPSYTFQELSSLDFEELIRDLLQAEWGIRLEAFKTGADSGIDLRYANDPNKTIIVQCKQYGISGTSKLLSHLRAVEAPKVSKLRPSRYVLVTSAGLSPANKAQIITLFHPFIKTPSDISGRDDVNNLLGRHPGVEQSNFKLWLTKADSDHFEA
jgi:hypothetical protein